MEEVKSIRKTGGIAAITLGAILMSTPAAAQGVGGRQDVVIMGVIDTQPSTYQRQGMEIIEKSFGREGYPAGVERVNPRKTHGDVVLDTVAETRTQMGDSRTYRVYHANPFVEMPSGGLAIDYAGLKRSIAWFSENGVRVVATSFASAKDAPGMADFVRMAKSSGIVVVASVGNGETKGIPYPAAYKDVITVDGHFYRQPDSPMKRDALARADAVFDGLTKARGSTEAPQNQSRNDMNQYATFGNKVVPIAGSSFASARAATYIAANLNANVTFENASTLIRSSVAEAGRPVIPKLLTGGAPEIVTAKGPASGREEHASMAAQSTRMTGMASRSR